MKGLRRLTEVGQVALALGLLGHGARITVVRAATDLPLQSARDLYTEVCGDSPSPGPLLSRATSLLSPYGRHRQAALFAALYQRQPGDPARLDGWRVLRAFEQYLALAPAATHRLDINAAWVLARDLRARLVTLHGCPRCRTPLLAATGAAGCCPDCRQPTLAAPVLAFAAAERRSPGPPPPARRRWRGTVTRAEARRIALALELLRHSARLPVVRVATNLPEVTLSALHQDLHGHSPRPGPLPVGAGTLLRPHGRHPHAALFAVLYQRRPSDPARLDGWQVLRAFEQYLALAPADTHRLDINAAWILARDLRVRLVTLCRCPRCATPFLRTSDSVCCPFCQPRTRAALCRRPLAPLSAPPPALTPPASIPAVAAIAPWPDAATGS